MGDCEASFSEEAESPMKHHSSVTEVLTKLSESRFGTMAAGQFDWGGLLLKSNGGVLKVPSARLAIVRRAHG